MLCITRPHKLNVISFDKDDDESCKIFIVNILLSTPQASPALACENIRFSSLFAAGDVSRFPPREMSPAARSEEKRMFSQATPALRD